MDEERNRTATENYRLLFSAVRRLSRSEPHVAYAVRLCGSVRELACELHVAYLKTVVKWLATPEPRRKLSTHVFNMVKWATHRLIGFKRIVYAPYYDSSSTLTEDTARRHEIANREHLNFNGTEGRCEDAALLVRDENRLLETEHAKTLITPLWKFLTKRQQLALKLRYTDGLDFEQCGRELKVTRERARQIILRAVWKMKDILDDKPVSKPPKPQPQPPKPQPPEPQPPWSWTTPSWLPKPEPTPEPKPELTPEPVKPEPTAEERRAAYALRCSIEAEGEQDRLDGLPVTANPYSPGTQEWRHWNNGWLPNW